MLGSTLVFLGLFGLGYGQQPNLTTFQGYTSRAWAADANRLCNKDLIYTTSPENNQMFLYVNEPALAPTFAMYEDLWQYYSTQENVEDPCVTNSVCNDDQDDFIAAMFATGPMAETYNYYTTYVSAGATDVQFRAYLKSLWFTAYSRGGLKNDSSAFNHVFIGEHTPEGDVGGFHNWYRLYKEIIAGNFLWVDENRPPCGTDIASFDSWWENQHKSVNSMWMRTSIEMEFSIYTLCFMYQKNSVCNALLDNHVQAIQTWDWKGSNFIIGSTYTLCS